MFGRKKYRKRMKEKPKAKRFSEPIKDEVNRLLRKDFSPEQITGVSHKNDIEMVSHETIYQHIWEDKKKEVIYILICVDKVDDIGKGVLQKTIGALSKTV